MTPIIKVISPPSPLTCIQIAMRNNGRPGNRGIVSIVSPDTENVSICKTNTYSISTISVTSTHQQEKQNNGHVSFSRVCVHTRTTLLSYHTHHIHTPAHKINQLHSVCNTTHKSKRKTHNIIVTQYGSTQYNTQYLDIEYAAPDAGSRRQNLVKWKFVGLTSCMNNIIEHNRNQSIVRLIWSNLGYRQSNQTAWNTTHQKVSIRVSPQHNNSYSVHMPIETKNIPGVIGFEFQMHIFGVIKYGWIVFMKFGRLLFKTCKIQISFNKFPGNTWGEKGKTSFLKRRNPNFENKT